MAGQITLKQGEAKKVRFAITKSGTAINVSNATFSFEVKANASDAVPVITKDDDDFDKTDGANGNVVLSFAVDDTKSLKAKTYVAELKTVVDVDDIDKSTDIPFVLERAVIIDA
jgi:hypothetical protein